ncbi:MAG: cation transporter [Euryarchaeota archaeon]|nr:cation transporter [Euryarchaeota archaeon]MDE1835981.1 cation transporter [Euryarchaeota archaeon]MDE1880977.1 cation transporter [Euryarchaeota archaeon]MDE2046027.1 cation transporter [Thermoplasmata archaeon]
MPGPHHGESEAEVSILSGLRWALVLSFLVLLIESMGAWFSHSLSLTTDAVHNVPDLVAFAVSWSALASTARGATAEHTFGMHRREVFAALSNALLILGSAIFFAFESVEGLLAHAPLLGAVDPVWIVAAAVPTLACRGVAAAMLGKIPRRARDLNLKSVFLHLLSDLAITGAVLFVAGVLLLRPSFGWVDPVAALFVAGVLGVESIPLFRESWVSLTEQVPRHLSVEAIARLAREVPHVQGLHDVHVWSVCSSLVCMTAHVRTEDVSVRESMQVVASLKERMAREFGIVHAVFEVEACAPTPHSHQGPEGCEAPAPG